ncbi:shufflon system plasmid conjugative transfer pilus tip adhesin PilV [Salmonella enterica]|uniref:Shufflon system plasmid conjugative transfer pilus tip adhesin PilV n=1 Tax=Salmonella virchow TaxID=48409 RepID=A0A3Y8PK33_SALVI|nr:MULTISPECIES: shufflon system plasmid conjugative transfer pilus tip adhesin PilV [Enterobacteriaceae]EAM3311588.1 shufflon system plasmid conjugative transfer pilus tip adhesin PilV [Salmonella enterica]EBX2100298.1 shufflon system plasmid conjugative transfer pilus tip adhesin PilV [Salmonella enterica subsp. enterica serovar Typhimurium]ECV1210812.1 shufflon system plasmid conjugative transfer pilus tip adhesin PilV [Salmonella enterica subsp. enterica]EDA6127891.1 shufflon system plasmid
MKKYDRGWASLEIGAALLIVMIIVAWGAGIWQDYLKTKGWQAEARLVSNWASAARSYIGKNYTTLQASSTTSTPAVITTTMLKNTGFLSSGFIETNSEGQRLQAYVVRNAQNPELLQAMVVSSGGTPYPVKALIQMAKDITTGLGGYIQDGKTATGALRSWSVALSNYGAKSGNGHIAVLLSTDELSGAAEDTDRLYRFQVNGRPDLNKMHTAIDMGSNNLNNIGAVNAQTGNFSGNVNGVNGTFSGQVKGNSGNFDVNVTAGGDIRSNNGWLITRNSKGWLNETHGGGFYMSDGSWVRSVNNKGIYTGGQVKGGTVRADGRLYTGEYLQLERTAVAGASCSPNGLVGRDNTGAILSCQSGTWRTIGGKLKVTQLSTTGYLGQFDFCAIARMGNAEDAHYCQVVESPAGSRKWYKYEHKTGCIASCVTLN